MLTDFLRSIHGVIRIPAKQLSIMRDLLMLIIFLHSIYGVSGVKMYN